MVSLMAFGFPGRFNMSALPRNPAVCLDSTAVGTTLRHRSTLGTAKLSDVDVWSVAYPSIVLIGFLIALP